MIDKFNSIALINNISKYFYFFSLAISSILVCIFFYIIIGGSFEGSINIDTIINKSENSYQYSNLNQIPFGKKFIGFSFVILTISLSLAILKYWKNFMSLVNQGRYFEIETIKNLQYISYFLFGIWTALFMIEIFTDIVFTTSISYEPRLDEDYTNNNIKYVDSSFSLPPTIFLINGIIFWVLSHILIEGIKIKKENELTI